MKRANDHPGRQAAFDKYIRNTRSDAVLSLSPTRNLKQVLYIENQTLGDDKKFKALLSMLRDNAWKYEMNNKNARSRSRSGSPNRNYSDILNFNNIHQIRIINCNIKPSKLTAILD